MANTERITQPSLGGNDVGVETKETHLAGVSSGTDTQLHLAAKSGNKHKKNINDDEKVVKNPGNEEGILPSGQSKE